jgi:DNA polymerase-3 subunit delta
MAVVKGQIDAYLKALPEGIDAVLLFGSDAGLVSERARKLAAAVAARTNPPGEILRLDEVDLENDPERLGVELRTIAMFGGRKIVRTQMSRRVNASMLKDLLGEARLEGFLIIEAGALKGDDALRKFIEAAQHAVAIPCNSDEGRDLETLVREVLGEHKLEIAADAKQMLIARLGADRALSRAEIDKLALFAMGQPRIEAADVEAVVGDAADLAIDRIVTAALSGQAALAATECDRAIASGESAQYVLIATLRALQRLHRVRLAVEAGQSTDDALKGLRPPLFYRARDVFLQQLDRWRTPAITRALARIEEGQALTRAGGSLGALDETVIVQGVLLDVARLAAVRARQ